MKYYFSKIVAGTFEEIVARVRAALTKHSFGVLTEIDVAAVMKAKLGIDMPAYVILGACNPDFAYRALQAESKIGTMLPCNVVVRDAGAGSYEIAAVDPVASMMAIENAALADIAATVRSMLQAVVEEA